MARSILSAIIDKFDGGPVGVKTNDVNHDRIEASYKDGVLAVTVEKKPESKSAKILIN
jgi:Hsp20/alpha crystallin family